MDGITAQMAPLVVAGNHWLRGGDLSRFWPDAKVFKYCKFVKFITLTGAAPDWNEHSYADDFLAWLQKQKDEGVSEFRLTYQPVNRGLANDRMSVAFVGGGGRKRLEAVHGNVADQWEAGWVAAPRDPNGNVWQVNYARISQGVAIAEPPDMQLAFGELERALAAILRFAEKDEDGKRFAPDFAAGLVCLTSDVRPKRSFLFPDIEPFMRDETAKRMLAACDAAWVFGGMGSWNDQGSGEEYETVSENLFLAIMHAVVAAVDSTFAPAKS